MNRCQAFQSEFVSVLSNHTQNTPDTITLQQFKNEIQATAIKYLDVISDLHDDVGIAAIVIHSDLPQRHICIAIKTLFELGLKLEQQPDRCLFGIYISVHGNLPFSEIRETAQYILYVCVRFCQKSTIEICNRFILSGQQPHLNNIRATLVATGYAIRDNKFVVLNYGAIQEYAQNQNNVLRLLNFKISTSMIIIHENGVLRNFINNTLQLQHQLQQEDQQPQQDHQQQDNLQQHQQEYLQKEHVHDNMSEESIDEIDGHYITSSSNII